MLNKYTLRVFDEIDDIGKDQIDAISNDPFFTYEWFKTLEISKAIESNPLYITMFDENRLVSFLPCFLDLANHYFRYRPDFAFTRNILNLGKHLSIWQNHILLCYSPFCFRSKILLATDSHRELANQLLDKVDAICKERKILFSSFEFVSENDPILRLKLQNQGYLKFPWWHKSLFIDNNWSSFEDYLATLSRWGRRTVRREIRKCQENGIEIFEEPNFEKISGRLSLLHSNLCKKYNNGKESPYTPLFFETLSRYAKDKVKVFVAKKEGKLVGFTLLMRQNEVADAYLTGYDYQSLTNTDFAYFNLSYYEPIKWAIKEQIKRINYRFSSEEAKLRRGCKQEKIFSLVKCHDKRLNFFFSFYARHKNRNKLAS